MVGLGIASTGRNPGGPPAGAIIGPSKTMAAMHERFEFAGWAMGTIRAGGGKKLPMGVFVLHAPRG
jgi:hypothetical protein